jgi:NADP-dependent 3-hydroxy acid dehydrogenase YdfG
MGILADKVAIVTGGGQGVGRGIALALAQEGAAIMLIGRTPSTLRQVAREIAQRGGTADIFQADVKLAADIKAPSTFSSTMPRKSPSAACSMWTTKVSSTALPPVRSPPFVS